MAAAQKWIPIHAGLGSRGLRSNSGTKAHAEKLFLNVGPSPGCPTRLPFLTHVCLVCLARLCPHGCPLSTHSLASPISVPSGCLAHRLPSGFWLCVCRYRVPALPALPLSLSKPAKLCPWAPDPLWPFVTLCDWCIELSESSMNSNGMICMFF